MEKVEDHWHRDKCKLIYLKSVVLATTQQRRFQGRERASFKVIPNCWIKVILVSCKIGALLHYDNDNQILRITQGKTVAIFMKSATKIQMLEHCTKTMRLILLQLGTEPACRGTLIGCNIALFTPTPHTHSFMCVVTHSHNPILLKPCTAMQQCQRSLHFIPCAPPMFPIWPISYIWSRNTS